MCCLSDDGTRGGGGGGATLSCSEVASVVSSTGLSRRLANVTAVSHTTSSKAPISSRFYSYLGASPFAPHRDGGYPHPIDRPLDALSSHHEDMPTSCRWGVVALLSLAEPPLRAI